MSAISTSAILLHRISRGDVQRCAGDAADEPRRAGPSMCCKTVGVWKDAACNANSGSCKNLCCMNAKSCMSAKLRGSFSCRIGMIGISQNLSC